jgi:hypothetical protein
MARQNYQTARRKDLGLLERETTTRLGEPAAAGPAGGYA